MRIRPDLSDARLIRLFHLGTKAQWTSLDYPRFLPDGWEPRAARALARLITPVYLGEQSAMAGANRAIAHFMDLNRTSYTIYLSTFMVDEARHLEALTRLYEQLSFPPTGIRELPDMLRYHHRMRAGKDIVQWVMGILVSDIFAKHFYRLLADVYTETPLGHMSRRVIVDESRHQAFAEHYLAARLPHLTDDEHQALWDLKEDLLAIIGRMGKSLDDDARALAIDGRDLFERFAEDVAAHCRRAGLVTRCKRCPLARSDAPDWSALAGRGCACEGLIPKEGRGIEEEGEGLH